MYEPKATQSSPKQPKAAQRIPKPSRATQETKHAQAAIVTAFLHAFLKVPKGRHCTLLAFLEVT